MTPLPLHEWKIEFSRFNYITSSLLSNQWTNGVIWSCCTIHFQDISIGTVDVRPGRIQNARSRNEIYLLADDAFHDELCAFWWLRSSRLRKSVTYRIYRTKRSGRFLYLHVSHDSNRICSTSFVVVVVDVQSVFNSTNECIQYVGGCVQSFASVIKNMQQKESRFWNDGRIASNAAGFVPAVRLFPDPFQCNAMQWNACMYCELGTLRLIVLLSNAIYQQCIRAHTIHNDRQ